MVGDFGRGRGKTKWILTSAGALGSALAFAWVNSLGSVAAAGTPLPQAIPQPWDSVASIPCAPESEYIALPQPVSVPTQVAETSPHTSSHSDARDPASAASGDASNRTKLALYAPPSKFDSAQQELDPSFCAEWNPDYGLKGVSCCGTKGIVQVRSRRKRPSCGPMRAKASYCDERTPDQVRYQERVFSGKISDPLRFLENESQKRLQQSYCSVGDGFLAWGKPILGTERNRILVKNPERCVNYGTDEMVGVLEWLGRRVADQYQGDEYAGVRLVVGNLSAPRGGCLSGMSGRRGHSSHTSGRDADLALFSAKPGRTSPEIFQTALDPESNFWLLREVFTNPVACVKVVFLDRRHIRSLAKWAVKHGHVSEWERISLYIKHVRGHRNHIHVRVGDVPGAPGCLASDPSWDSDEEEEGIEGEPSPDAPDLEEDDSDEQDNPGEVADILRSLGARPLRPQESKLSVPSVPVESAPRKSNHPPVRSDSSLPPEA